MGLIRNSDKYTLPFGNNPTAATSEGFLQQAQNLGITNKVFTPTWEGFSSEPTGNLFYMDLGDLVVLWTDTQRTGTSNGVTFVIRGLPKAIWPATSRLELCLVIVGIDFVLANATISNAGNVSFTLADTTTSSPYVEIITPFPAAGGKGLPPGWRIMYAK